MEYCRDNETEATVVGNLDGYSFTSSAKSAPPNELPMGNVENITNNSSIADFSVGSSNWEYVETNNQVISKELDYYFKRSGKIFNVDWRLIAAWCFLESGFNVNARPKNNNGGYKSTAGGIWQFVDNTWNAQAPKGCKENYPNYTYRFNPDISERAFDNLFEYGLKQFSNATSRKNQIALAIQAHEGMGEGEKKKAGKTEWKNCPMTHEKYLQTILKRYNGYCSKK